MAPLLSRQAVQVLGRDQSFSAARAEELLGWKPGVGYAEGLQATLGWLRERPRRPRALAHGPGRRGRGALDSPPCASTPSRPARCASSTRSCSRAPGARRQLDLFLPGPFSDPLPIHCWAIEHEEPADARRYRRDRGRAEHPVRALRSRARAGAARRLSERRGCRAEDVDEVVLTHHHGDHVDGIVHVPAPVRVARRGARVRRAAVLAPDAPGAAPAAPARLLAAAVRARRRPVRRIRAQPAALARRAHRRRRRRPATRPATSRSSASTTTAAT